MPSPIKLSEISLPSQLEDVIEIIAKNVHETWVDNRLKDGWTYGETRNDDLKQHPCLIPYEQLSEEERNYDRQTAITTLKTIYKLGFNITSTK